MAADRWLEQLGKLVVTRILQNPLGGVAPAGEVGDIVCVSDGRSKVYLDPEDFDSATKADLRAMLVEARTQTARSGRRR